MKWKKAHKGDSCRTGFVKGQQNVSSVNNGALDGTETLSDSYAYAAVTVMWCRHNLTTNMNTGGSISTEQEY